MVDCKSKKLQHHSCLGVEIPGTHPVRCQGSGDAEAAHHSGEGLPSRPATPPPSGPAHRGATPPFRGCHASGNSARRISVSNNCSEEVESANVNYRGFQVA